MIPNNQKNLLDFFSKKPEKPRNSTLIDILSQPDLSHTFRQYPNEDSKTQMELEEPIIEEILTSKEPEIQQKYIPEKKIKNQARKRSNKKNDQMELEKSTVENENATRGCNMEEEEEVVKIEQPKIDYRKLNSGRKAKSLKATFDDYKKNFSFSGWLADEDKFSCSGDVEKYLFCSWCRAVGKNNQMAQGILFGVNGVICKSFSSTRIQEHSKINNQHKQARVATLQHLKFLLKS